MTDNLARWLLGILTLIGLAGIGLTDHDFDPNDPWFFIGLAMFLASCVAINGTLREWRTRTLSDEFQAGYRVGYRAGRRLPLTVTRPATVSAADLIPFRRRQTAGHKHTNGLETWPDSESSPPGNIRHR